MWHVWNLWLELFSIVYRKTVSNLKCVSILTCPKKQPAHHFLAKKNLLTEQKSRLLHPSVDTTSVYIISQTWLISISLPHIHWILIFGIFLCLNLVFRFCFFTAVIVYCIILWDWFDLSSNLLLSCFQVCLLPMQMWCKQYEEECHCFCSTTLSDCCMVFLRFDHSSSFP